MKSVIPVYDFPHEAKAFVERGLWGGRRQFGECVAIGFANATEGLVAGIVYHNYEPQSGVIEISAYASNRRWCTKTALTAIFEYPFNQLGLRLVVARQSERNRTTRRIFKALGAKEYLIDDLRADGEAEAIAVLSRKTWLNSKFARQ